MRACGRVCFGVPGANASPSERPRVVSVPIVVPHIGRGLVGSIATLYPGAGVAP